VNGRIPEQDPLRLHLKHIVADMFRPDILDPAKISDDEPLSGAGFCLDSLDVLELALCVEEEFGVAVRRDAGSLNDFASIASLIDSIQSHARTSSASRRAPAAAPSHLERPAQRLATDFPASASLRLPSFMSRTRSNIS
jgi:acyl carrier protein